MIKKAFNIELLEDVILPQTGATTSGASSLDYIPGGVILGLVATKYYEKAQEDDMAWDIFHSGKVRFLNAYPIINDNISMPLPFCWHAKKNISNEAEKPIANGLIRAKFVRNNSFDEKDKETQYKQLREGYFTKFGDFKKLIPVRRQKTAIDRQKLGQSRDGHFFGVSAIPKGSKFCFSIEADDNIAIDEIVRVLTKNNHFIGRSKTAEFGRVQITKSEKKCDFLDDKKIKESSEEIKIYCASDIILPNNEISAQDFGLSNDWEIDGEKTFIRRRRFAIYNGHRSGFSQERDVISKGSVIVFYGGVLTGAEIEKLNKGVGLNLAQGYGQVIANFPFISGETPERAISKASNDATDSNKANNPKDINDDLFKWAKERSVRDDINILADGYSIEYEKKLEKLCNALNKKAKTENKAPKEFMPSKSQWGNVRNFAIDAKSTNGFFNKLFDEKTGALTKGVGSKAWNETEYISWKNDKNDISCSIALKEFISEKSASEYLKKKEAKYIISEKDYFDQFILNSTLALANRMRKVMDKIDMQRGSA